MMLSDAKEREQALDPRKSFIVQAPAGSGKTELLTRRFIQLLNIVKQPEEILAITFTKKSAAEMRARVIKTLQNNPEQYKELLKNPNRLQIQTIDSLNASLTRHLPLLSHFGGQVHIADDPSVLYQEAVQELLAHLEENVSWADAIEKLLIHMNNDLYQVQKLLIHMLSKRDQWLVHITYNDTAEILRKLLENNLKERVLDSLKLLHDTFPKTSVPALLELIRFAANHLPLDTKYSCLLACKGLKNLPGYELKDQILWSGIFELLFTKEREFRKKMDKNLGFPPAFKEKKCAMEELLLQLSENRTLKTAFDDLYHLPAIQYQDAQWDILYALQEVLRMAAAQLKIVFQKQGKIDYIENAQAALSALGSEENPTDLTLALDYKIQHILIDEFQDTSAAQFRLIEKLTSGWQPEDGRTLFLVGDPMQSIYRFREAEVGLFMRARQYGIGKLLLQSLQLSSNFRSDSGIIHWINQHFKSVFPLNENIAKGAVRFTPSSDVKSPINEGLVNLHSFCDAPAASQANKMIEIIQKNQKNFPDRKIAILVRSRNHLEYIIPALKSAGLSFRALEIEPLSQRPIIQDLLSLTKALVFLNDKIAWLAILRAPWCGLRLEDLLIIAGGNDTAIIWQGLENCKLTAEGALSLNRILPILKLALSERRRYTLRDWIENTWLQLGGPACYSISDIDDAEAYFKLLEKLETGNMIEDLRQLEKNINKLYAAPNKNAKDSLQIMTIHNAKGLEFDTVILPHLERLPAKDNKQLLQWMEWPREHEDPALLLAPVHAVGEQPHSIYEFIKRQQQIKDHYEQARLLYVAATRTKKELHILFDLQKDKNNNIKTPSGNSLLQTLWPAIKDEIGTQELSLKLPEIKSHKSGYLLKRLSLNWKNPLQNNKITESGRHQNPSSFILPDKTASAIGTVIHRILQMLCLNQHSWFNLSPDQQKNYIASQLLRLGIQQEETAERVQRAINITLNDPRGQWILKPHSDSQTEFAITAVIDKQIKHCIIDRTFIDENNIRWIIDYKSSSLFDDEPDRYIQQLQQYAQAMNQWETRPIHLGLYFPLTAGWREWEYEV